jgi:hypothetical protein
MFQNKTFPFAPLNSPCQHETLRFPHVCSLESQEPTIPILSKNEGENSKSSQRGGYLFW